MLTGASNSHLGDVYCGAQFLPGRDVDCGVSIPTSNLTCGAKLLPVIWTEGSKANLYPLFLNSDVDCKDCKDVQLLPMM